MAVNGLVGAWGLVGVLTSYGVCVWKYIRRDWCTISKIIKFEVDDGTNVCFWHDHWCGEGAL